MPGDFRLMDVARQVEDEVNDLLARSRRPLLHRKQLEDSAQSIPANIREAFGRRHGPERNQYFRVARSSSEETDEHLRSNAAAQRLDSSRYWRLHHRLTVIRKMLGRLMGET
jgi:four helix bundle protein